MKTKTAPKIITVALLRDLETQVHIKQEISYSRMVEILNEKATQQVTAATEEMQNELSEVKRERDEYYAECLTNRQSIFELMAATDGWRHDYKSVKSALSAQKRINAELKKRCEELEAQVEYWKK